MRGLDNMETKKLKFVNANQKEGEALYREVYQDFSDFKQHVSDYDKDYKSSSEEIETVEKVLSILDDVEDEGIQKFCRIYSKEIEKSKNAFEQADEYREHLHKTLERSESFMERFKEEFVIDEETQETTLGYGALLLLEYLHTVHKTVQQEEQKQKQ